MATRLARDGAHLVLAGGDAHKMERTAASLPPESVRIAGDDALAMAIAAFGGADVFVAFDPMSPGIRHRLHAVLARQEGGTIVGLDAASGATVDLGQRSDAGVRTNAVRVEPGADPDMAAAAIAFLASSNGAAINRAIIPIGSSPHTSPRHA